MAEAGKRAISNLIIPENEKENSAMLSKLLLSAALVVVSSSAFAAPGARGTSRVPSGCSQVLPYAQRGRRRRGQCSPPDAPRTAVRSVQKSVGRQWRVIVAERPIKRYEVDVSATEFAPSIGRIGQQLETEGFCREHERVSDAASEDGR